MKPMNRLLSFVLSCAMVMILCIPAFAINLLTDEPFDEPFVMDIDNGKLFSAASEDKTVAILTNDDLHLIDISISYDPACDEVYHWAISDYPVDEFSYSDFEDSDLVLFTTTIYDTSDSSVDASLSSESNLR